MFWDSVAWVYDIFADGINRKANRKLCKVVAGLISPTCWNARAVQGCSAV